jgi:hypothetical protein
MHLVTNVLDVRTLIEEFLYYFIFKTRWDNFFKVSFALYDYTTNINTQLSVEFRESGKFGTILILKILRF